MTRLLLAVIVLLAMTVLGLLWSLLLPIHDVHDTHDEMLTLLREVQRRTADENPYLGDAELRQVTQRLQDNIDTLQRSQLHWQRGNSALRLGRNIEAIEAFQNFYNILPDLREHVTAEVLEKYRRETLLKLSVSHLRIGEVENCVNCRTGESCILPIQGQGIHVRKEGSKKAIEYLELLLQRAPDDHIARWLLNVAHMTLGTYPDGVPPDVRITPDLFRSKQNFPRFADVAAELGLDTFSLAGGVVCDDFNGDGLLDIIVSDWDPSVELRYFRNERDGSFSDRSQEAGFGGMLGGLNLKQADYDNDGDLDLLVLRGGWMGKKSAHPNSLLRNNGQGSFRDVTISAGLADYQCPTQTAEWADYDNDGDLDLYVGNEDVPSQLFRNNGKGVFSEVAQSAGVANYGYAKGVAWGDYDNDRFPDLYVSNLGGQNRLYHNNRNGTFTDVASECGVAGPIASFPVWSWDFNNDGAIDFYVSAYDLDNGIAGFVSDFLDLPHKAQVDHLYQGDSNGGFRNVAAEQGVARVTLPMGSNFGDLNADGFPDYYLGTGYQDYEALMPNRMFLNDGGTGFTDISIAGGFSHLQKGHAVSFADFDNDGDQDVFIVMGGAFAGDGFSNALFKNPGFGNNWITIDLIGTTSNRCAIGARIHLKIQDDGEQRSIYKWVNSGGSFGGNPLRRNIGVGKATRIDLLEVYWPASDQVQRFHDVSVGQRIEITEGEDRYQQR
ncbi:MAG: CRTAC1 family protein [Fuerstiella sp.]|jgi:tetratricopeptide (TPR) repeat protein|nr:CRTAC1 family protein [Fuerstiella sp.]